MMEKIRYMIGICILLIMAIGCSNEKKFSDEEYIKAISTDLKMSYPRENVSGDTLAFNFIGNYGDHLLFINGGEIKWKVEKKDRIEVVGEIENYSVKIYFPITIKNDEITINEDEIYIEDKEYNLKLTLGEVRAEERRKEKYLNILRGMELSSTTLKGKTMDYLTYQIFKRAGSHITQPDIKWEVYLNENRKNEIKILATDNETAEISYLMYKEADEYSVSPNEIIINYYNFGEEVSLTDWLFMYEANNYNKKYQILESQFN